MKRISRFNVIYSRCTVLLLIIYVFVELGWWFNTENKYFKATESSDLSVGFDKSLEVVQKAFQEQGPFDGILGFSQGASFVSILCNIHQKKSMQSMINLILSMF